MQLVETVKLYLNNYKKKLVACTMKEYITTVNSLVSMDIDGISIAKIITASVDANLPSALTNQCIRDAKSIVKNYRKKCRDVERINKELEKKKYNVKKNESTVPVVKRQCCYINSQNFKIKVLNGDGASWTEALTPKGGIYQKDYFRIVKKINDCISEKYRSKIIGLEESKASYKKIYNELEKIKYKEDEIYEKVLRRRIKRVGKMPVC